MAFLGLNALDNESRCIGSRLWKETACGNPSSSTWVIWRAECGVALSYRRSDLTRYEAFLLFTRSRLQAACKATGHRFPSTRNWETLTPIADAYARYLKESGALERVEQAALISNMEGRQVLEVAHLFAGESISEATVRRRLKKVGIILQKGRVYSVRQVRRMMTAIAP
jgi:hypothetical protein